MTSQRISLNGEWQFKGYLDLDWQRRGSLKPDTSDVYGWYTGRVPGSVHDDLWRNGVIPNPYYEQNSLLIEWVSERYWVYKRTFFVPEEWRDKTHIWMRFEGVDYEVTYYVNGRNATTEFSQYWHASFTLENLVVFGAENQIAVVLYPAPREQSQNGRTSLVTTGKTRMNYGWDFCPRMPHVGIWKDAYIEAVDRVQLDDVWVRTNVTDNHERATILVTVAEFFNEPASSRIEVTMRPPAIGRYTPEPLTTGSQTTRTTHDKHIQTLPLEIEKPTLWYPNGEGEQPLYTLEVRLIDPESDEEYDSRTLTFGIRTLAWARNEDSNDDALPYTLLINGRKTYMHGWNWVPMDVLYGVPNLEKLENLLILARRAGVNLLRCNGVGLIESEAFYNLCDRLGIMVWQEFILSSSAIDRDPINDAVYVNTVLFEAESIIPQKRNHPSLVIWCGGNELENEKFLPLDDTEPILAELKKLVEEADGTRLWLPTSASGPMPFCGINTATNNPRIMHDVHGPWHHQGLTGQYTLFNRSQALLHSEFGAETLTNETSMRRAMSDANRLDMSLHNPVWRHMNAEHWLRPKEWRDMYGDAVMDEPDPETRLRTLIRATQFTQAEAVKYTIEANRRRVWQNSGSLPWMFNEPYPNAVGNSAVDYYGDPKAVYYAVKRAYERFHVSARFDSMVWANAETFTAQIYGHNPLDHALEQVLCDVRLVGASGTVYYEQSHNGMLPAEHAASILEFTFPLTDVDVVFFLDLWMWSEEHIVPAQNRYTFTRTPNLAPLFRAPATTLEVRRNDNSGILSITNTGTHTALFVQLEDLRTEGQAHAYFDDNHLCIFPGETRSVAFGKASAPADDRRIGVVGWNTERMTV
jgi:beta-mannosidase